MKLKPGTTVVVHPHHQKHRAFLAKILPQGFRKFKVSCFVEDSKGSIVWVEKNWLSKPKFKHD